MSQFEQDPSANTGRFRAFVERGAEDSGRSRISPVVLVIGVVVVIAVIAAIVGLA